MSYYYDERSTWEKFLGWLKDCVQFWAKLGKSIVDFLVESFIWSLPPFIVRHCPPSIWVWRTEFSEQGKDGFEHRNYEAKYCLPESVRKQWMGVKYLHKWAKEHGKDVVPLILDRVWSTENLWRALVRFGNSVQMRIFVRKEDCDRFARRCWREHPSDLQTASVRCLAAIDTLSYKDFPSEELLSYYRGMILCARDKRRAEEFLQENPDMPKNLDWLVVWSAAREIVGRPLTEEENMLAGEILWTTLGRARV